MSNEVPFVPYAGIGHNLRRWELTRRPTDTGLATFSATSSSLSPKVFGDDSCCRIFCRCPRDPREPYGPHPLGVAFYLPDLDSRRIGMYYTSVRPISDRPLFAQRGWRRRYQTIAKILDAQQRRAAERGDNLAGWLSVLDLNSPPPPSRNATARPSVSFGAEVSSPERSSSVVCPRPSSSP
ncbi:m169/m168as protein [Murid betaherpesvirus 1]|nr:m169/m168as protein [Murid betaherpesvirus 1]